MTPRPPFPRRPERGSVLALVPAGFLVLIVLAAIAVDSAVAFLGQRQLGDALGAAANDAAGSALSPGAFYRSGTLAIDPAAAARVVCQAVAAQGDANLHHITVAVAVAGPVVGVRGSALVDEVFGRVLPGLHQRRVSAVATAVAAPGAIPAPPSPAAYHTISC